GDLAADQPARARPAVLARPVSVRRIRGPGRPGGIEASPPQRDGERRPTRPAPSAPRSAPRPSPAAKASDAGHPEGSMRLSKRMSELGLASRREADEWIARGWVRVDGRVVAELGSRVLPEQRITVDAKATNQQAQRVTVL